MKSTEESKLNIVYQNIVQLHSNPHNARTHSKRQIRQIAESMRQFGWTTPILIDANNVIIAGHGRKAAAKLLGIVEVPTIQLDGLTREQIRAYVIADNKLAENAGWDRDILAIEFQELLALDCADFDLTITGFETPEIDLILEEAKAAAEEEAPPEPDFDQEPITTTGDLWLLRKHRIICGNSLSPATYQTLLGNRHAAMVFTDPPFNVRIDGHATGNGAIQHREFAMASGEMSEVEFISFLNNCLGLIADHSANGSVHYVCIDWRHFGELLTAGRRNYDEFLTRS